MTNIERARRVIAGACASGVRDFCVCAGSRNSPLLAVLARAEGVRLYSFVDERAAAFFALGRAKRDRRPVAVVTTSGTAVAELLPATIEAFYSGIPLVLITADRPARYRGTGAPQTIEQNAIFGPYAAAEFSPSRPQHVNVEFDEPLIDAAPSAWKPEIAEARPVGQQGDPAVLRFRRPLVIVSSLREEYRSRVRDFALALNAPVYAEALSGLREDARLRPLLITAGERMLGRAEFDGVIRIGGVPTLRFWRDLEESRSDVPVVHFSPLPFAGLTRGDVHPIEALPAAVAPVRRDEAFFRRDREMTARIGAILDDDPRSELAMLRALSAALPEGARVYLGNSLPVREWDLVATREPRGYEIEASRGANGIDGQLSTFFGLCDPSRPNVAVVGDLTALYDMNAPWIVPRIDAPFRIVVVNNGGGRIFGRVPSLRALDVPTREQIIENVHAFRFDRWAEMWGLRHFTEMLPDAEASERVWRRYDELWS